MGIILNPGQRVIVEEAKKWYRSANEQVFQIQGPPGTGKSVTLNAIIDELGLNRDHVAPMSFIGAAAINMRVKGFYNAKTIHSWLYRPVEQVMLDESGKPIIDSYFNKPKKHLVFEPKPLGDIDLMVIDEAYATPLSLKKDIECRNKLILAAGDKDQLSPVKDAPAYLVDGKIYYLDEIMRQEEGSAIIYLSQRIKQGLPIHSGYYSNVLVIENEELNDDIISRAEVIICGRNDTRDIMNNHIRRDILRKTSRVPEYGERMVCRKNNFHLEVDGISLANGLMGKVTSHVDPSSFNNKTYTIDFQPDLMGRPFQRLQCDYNYLLADNDKRQQLKLDRFSRGEKFEYAYAITSHISQGSEWDKGIYLEEHLNPSMDARLAYVGLTRFRKSCIFVKAKRRKYYI